MKTVEELLNATNTEIERDALELFEKQCYTMSNHQAVKKEARSQWRRLALKVHAIRELRGDL